jgi:hypothetical protein
MELIRRIYEPDVAVLPIGDHFTMGPREAAVALELLGVRAASRAITARSRFSPGRRTSCASSPPGSRSSPPSRARRSTFSGHVVRERWLGATGVRVPRLPSRASSTCPMACSGSTTRHRKDCAPRTKRAAPWSPAPPPQRTSRRACAPRGRLRARPARSPRPPRPRPDRTDVRLSVSRQVAFVLGGGGHLGAAEVGMLGALFEREIRPDLILGTSVGALHGAAAADDRHWPRSKGSRCCGADCRSSACSATG